LHAGTNAVRFSPPVTTDYELPCLTNLNTKFTTYMYRCRLDGFVNEHKEHFEGATGCDKQGLSMFLSSLYMVSKI